MGWPSRSGNPESVVLFSGPVKAYGERAIICFAKLSDLSAPDRPIGVNYNAHLSPGLLSKTLIIAEKILQQTNIQQKGFPPEKTDFYDLLMPAVPENKIP